MHCIVPALFGGPAACPCCRGARPSPALEFLIETWPLPSPYGINSRGEPWCTGRQWGKPEGASGEEREGAVQVDVWAREVGAGLCSTVVEGMIVSTVM